MIATEDSPEKSHELGMRFWSKVQKSEGCWAWQAAKRGGYGAYFLSRRMRPAHRVSYEALHGPVPAGLELDHLCRNRACVRPDHLEPVTSSENKYRSPLIGRSGGRNQRAGGNNGNGLKSHCAAGHLFDAANTYITRIGTRACRACNAASHLRRKAARQVQEVAR